MKRFLYLLLLLPLLAGVSSCSDDDDNDIPQVNLSLNYSGATVEDDVFYVVSGDPFVINSLTAVPVEGTKAAVVSAATYYWDGQPFYYTPVSPFTVSIDTEMLRPGRHTLGIYANILQVGKPAGFAVADFPVMIVERPEEQPGDQASGTLAISPTLQ